MNVKRRGFLQLLGGAAVGGKQIAEDIAKQAGVTLGLGVDYGDGSGIAGPPSQRNFSISRWFLKNALPEWKLDEIRKNSRVVTHLDPDLAALRSFSMTAKIGIQQQRNFNRSVRELSSWHELEEARSNFHDQHGFWL